ncbi:hypothetical protein PHMEG_0002397 [Phytophthora megakarya]|uniref:Uncharacterized protein n=1 Tax=Phytophthora megakarya TaxID=4795 RepID=A0A225WZB4_9STRA|nr:hypothetical protein PHMEG_0002397 [Phytophthora megakarya]
MTNVVSGPFGYPEANVEPHGRRIQLRPKRIHRFSGLHEFGAGVPATWPGNGSRTFPSAPGINPGGPLRGANRRHFQLYISAPTWDSSFGSTDQPSSRPKVSHPWEAGVPGYGESFRPFIANDAVEPFDTSLSLDKGCAWWDKFPTRSAVGYGGSKSCAPVSTVGSRTTREQGLGVESVRRSWRQLSGRFYQGFSRSTESPVSIT